MFTYCGNNPLAHSDHRGYSKANALSNFSDKYCSYALQEDIGGGVGAIGGLWITGQLVSALVDAWENFSNFFYPRSKKIDWEAGDKNHILKGSFGKHIPGWQRFGIDPENGDKDGNWLLVLRILKEAVDKADYYYTKTNGDGTLCTFYVKTFVEEGVKLVVKIWNGLDGTIQQLSDAITYLIK